MSKLPEDSEFPESTGVGETPVGESSRRVILGLDEELDPENKTGAKRVVTESFDNDSQLLACMQLVRRAHSLLSCAFNGVESAESPLQFFSACDAITEAWRFAGNRSQSFRDLLALVEVSVRDQDLESIQDSARHAILGAANSLRLAFVAEEVVSSHRRAMMKAGIDILRPFTSKPERRKFKITVEEIPE